MKLCKYFFDLGGQAWQLRLWRHQRHAMKVCWFENAGTALVVTNDYLTSCNNWTRILKLSWSEGMFRGATSLKDRRCKAANSKAERLKLSQVHSNSSSSFSYLSVFIFGIFIETLKSSLWPISFSFLVHLVKYFSSNSYWKSRPVNFVQ